MYPERLYPADIMEVAGAIGGFLEGVDPEEFMRDELRQSAVFVALQYNERWAVDRRIQTEEDYAHAVEALFKTLLHQLMTGKVWVNSLSLAQGG